MSYWSDLFATDNPDALRMAFENADPIEGTDLVLGHVNLPGILPDVESGNSMEVLTEQVCKATSTPLRNFMTSADEDGAGEADPGASDSGAFVLGASWVNLVASLDDRQRETIARGWLKEWDPGAVGDPGSLGPVSDLVCRVSDLCRLAQQRGISLVYTWTL